MSRWRAESGYLGRYVGSGALNTVVGLSVIFGVTAVGVSPYLANVAGYAVGLVLGFWTARAFVFRGTGDINREGWRYLLSFAISWLLNFLILRWSMKTLGLDPLLAQIVAAIGYSTAMYLFGRYFVFLFNAKNGTRNNRLFGHLFFLLKHWISKK